MGLSDHDRRVLFVHAHPDDESIWTGATMASYAAAGARVTLVTCTLGEEGEVVPDELRYLASDRDDRLGEYRIPELAAACEALGVRDHRFLGGPGRWRDSGMMGTPPNDDPGSFWRADVDEAAAELVKVIRETKPQVVVTYDDHGFYGHPDHIQAHRVAWRAFWLAGDASFGEGPVWTVSKFYATAMPLSVLPDAFTLPADSEFLHVGPLEELGYGAPDDQVTTVIDGCEHLAAKVAALRAHRTQITVSADGEYFALSNDIGQKVMATEYYTLLVGKLGQTAAGGRETDLFAGLDG